MRTAVAAVLLAVLPACAADGGDGGKLQVGDGGKLQVAESTASAKSPEPPILIAKDGPDTLRFQNRSKFELRPNGYVFRAWEFTFAFESTEPDTLLTERSAFECRAMKGSEVHVERDFPTHWAPGLWGVRVPWESYLGTASDIDVDVSVFLVRKWSEHEAPGLMDASLDELEWPPFLLRFAGEGESCWLSVSMLDREKPPEGEKDPATVVDFRWAARSVTVMDAKGRVLVQTISDSRENLEVASFSTHRADSPPPEGESTIQYPVTVRLLVPAKWTSEVRRFRFRGLPHGPYDSPK